MTALRFTASVLLLSAATVLNAATGVKISDLGLSTSPSTNTYLEIADLNASGTNKSAKILYTNLATQANLGNYVLKAGDTMTGPLLTTALTNTDLTASRAVVSGADKALASSATTATEIGYVNGVTSSIQAQLDAKLSTNTAASTYVLKAGDTMTGPLTITNAASGTAPFVINDVSGGTGNRIQLNVGGVNKFGVDKDGIITGANILTISNMTDTWNNAGTTFTAIKMNVTDTASGAGSLLMDLQIAGSTKVSVTKLGSINFQGTQGVFDAAGYLRLSTDTTYGLSIANNAPLRMLSGSSGYTGTAYRFQVTNGNQAQALVQTGTNATMASIGGTIKVDTTTNGNTADTNEDNLTSYTLGANVLATNGDRIEGTAAGTFAANGDNKTLKLYFGATAIADTTALAFNNASWSIKFTIIRTSATAQKAITTIDTGSALLTTTTSYTTPAETLSGTVVLKCTGQSGAATANNIKQELLAVNWMPNK